MTTTLKKEIRLKKGRRPDMKKLIVQILVFVMMASFMPVIHAYEEDVSDYFYEEVGEQFIVTANVRMRSNAERLMVMPALVYIKESDSGRTLNYSGANLNKFKDYNSYDSRSFTNKQITEMKKMEINDILSGRPDLYGNLYIDAKEDITRGEFVKVVVTSLESLGIRIRSSSSRNITFEDLKDDYGNPIWSSEYIYKAVDMGLIKGVSSYKFAPEDPISYQDATLIIIRIGRETGMTDLQIATALDNLDYLDVDYLGEDSTWGFTKSTIYTIEDTYFDLSSVMTGKNRSITYTSRDETYATVNSNGRIYSRKATSKGVNIVAEDDYGNRDTIKVIISSADDTTPEPTPIPTERFKFSLDDMSIELNSVEDIMQNVEYYYGNVTFKSSNPAIASISGKNVCGNKVGTVVITGTDSNGNSDTMNVHVRDNSSIVDPDELDITFEFGEPNFPINQEQGSVNFTVRGLPTNMNVKVNDNSNYRIADRDRNGTTLFAKIEGLEPLGGYDSIILTVYIESSGKVVTEYRYDIYSGEYPM